MSAAGVSLNTIVDISQITARAHMPHPEADLLKVGDKASITVPGLDEPVTGKVTVVSPALDPNSTTVEVWAQAANPQRSLKPGTSVKLPMLAQTIPDAQVVAASSLLTATDGS